MLSVLSDEYFMKQAIAEAMKSSDAGEVPVGAIIVSNHKIIARAHNRTEALNDVTAHAEMLAITAASEYFGSKYLKDCTIYVTLEPCPMCATALNYAQINKVVYAAEDLKNGYLKFGKELLHPKTKVEFGLQQEMSVQLLKSFFKQRR